MSKILTRVITRRLRERGIKPVLAEGAKVLTADVYYTHKVMDHIGASQEMAQMLSVPWNQTSSLWSVWRSFVYKCFRSLPKKVREHPEGPRT